MSHCTELSPWNQVKYRQHTNVSSASCRFLPSQLSLSHIIIQTVCMRCKLFKQVPLAGLWETIRGRSMLGLPPCWLRTRWLENEQCWSPAKWQFILKQDNTCSTEVTRATNCSSCEWSYMNTFSMCWWLGQAQMHCNTSLLHEKCKASPLPHLLCLDTGSHCYC